MIRQNFASTSLVQTQCKPEHSLQMSPRFGQTSVCRGCVEACTTINADDCIGRDAGRWDILLNLTKSEFDLTIKLYIARHWSQPASHLKTYWHLIAMVATSETTGTMKCWLRKLFLLYTILFFLLFWRVRYEDRLQPLKLNSSNKDFTVNYSMVSSE